MSTHWMALKISPRMLEDAVLQERRRFELFVMWHRRFNLEPDTTKHYLIGTFGEGPLQEWRMTRANSIREVQFYPELQPIARDQVALYAQEMQRWGAAESSSRAS